MAMKSLIGLLVSTVILGNAGTVMADNERVVYPAAKYEQLIKAGVIVQDNDDFDNDEYIQKLDSWGMKPTNLPLPYNPTDNTYDSAYQPYTSDIIFTHHQDLLYSLHPRKADDGQNTHTFAPYARMPTSTSPVELTSDIKTKDFNKDGMLVFDTAVGDLDGDNQEEIINFFFEETASYGKRLRVNILAVTDSTRGHNFAGDNQLLESTRTLYTTNESPKLTGKLKEATPCTWLQAETADTDGDFIDDVLVTQFCGEVKIWSAINGNAYKNGYKLAENISRDTTDMEKVSLATGDIDGDNRDELVVTYAYKNSEVVDDPLAPEPFMKVYNLNSNGKIANSYTRNLDGFYYGKPMNDRIQVNPTAVTIANIDLDPLNEIVIGGSPWNLISLEDKEMNQLAVVFWDPSNSASDPFGSGSWDEQTFFFTNDTGSWNYSRQTYPEIITWDPFGWEKGELIVYGGHILQYNWGDIEPGSHQFLNMVDTNLFRWANQQSSNTTFKFASFAVGNFTLRQEEEIEGADGDAEADITDDNRQELFLMPYQVTQDKEDNVRRFHSGNAFSHILSISDDTMKEVGKHPTNLTKNNVSLFDASKLYATSGSDEDFTIDSQDYMLNYPRPVMGDFLGQRLKLSYLGEEQHYVAFSDPIIYGAMAYPPFYANSMHGDDTRLSIAYTGTEGNGDGSGSGSSFQYKGGIKVKFSLFGIGAEVAFKGMLKGSQMRMQDNYTYTTGRHTIDFGLVDDALLMSLTPYDIYQYEIVGAPDLDSIGDTMEVYTPRRPILHVMGVNRYNDSIAEEDAFKLFERDDYFQHTVGVPASYPPFEKFSTMWMNEEPVIWADENGANFEDSGHELSIIQGQQNTNTFSLAGGTGAELNTVLGVAAIDIRHMKDVAKNVYTTHEESTEISAYVPKRDTEERDTLDSYNWGIYAYPQKVENVDTDMDLLIIDYWYH